MIDCYLKLQQHTIIQCFLLNWGLTQLSVPHPGVSKHLNFIADKLPQFTDKDRLCLISY